MEEKVSEIKKKNSLRGKKARAAGRRFEAKVRESLGKMGWIVDKWTNTIDNERNKIVPAKRKYNPFSKVMSIGTGFPDFVCFRRTSEGFYEVAGIEVKANGYLDKVEKGMCLWLLKNKIFSRILVAKAKKSGRKIEVEYIDVSENFK